jgi:SAM-dependent methyltransferase
MGKLVQRLMKRYYSESCFDGTTMFYGWLRENARPNHRVLNLGAGPAARHPTRILKGEVAEVVGADIDPVVHQNDELDRSVLICGDTVGLPGEYFDVIFSDMVLEHVERPEAFLVEVHRLLKPGGCFMFRTPNFYHYVALISWVTPQWFHEIVANPVRGLPKSAHPPWPTFYRMNTARRLHFIAAKAGFENVELRFIECEPSYLQFHALPFLIGVAYERVVNATSVLQGFRANLFGRMGKSAHS